MIFANKRDVCECRRFVRTSSAQQRVLTFGVVEGVFFLFSRVCVRRDLSRRCHSECWLFVRTCLVDGVWWASRKATAAPMCCAAIYTMIVLFLSATTRSQRALLVDKVGRKCDGVDDGRKRHFDGVAATRWCRYMDAMEIMIRIMVSPCVLRVAGMLSVLRYFVAVVFVVRVVCTTHFGYFGWKSNHTHRTPSGALSEGGRTHTQWHRHRLGQTRTSELVSWWLARRSAAYEIKQPKHTT